MDNRTIHDLERRIQKLEREAVRFRKGQVTATAPLQAKIGASEEVQTANTVSGTNMQENDPVAALSNSTDLLLLGKIVDEPTGVSLTTTTQWNEQSYLTDVGALSQASQNLGYSVAITSDGSRAVVGAPYGDILSQTNEGYLAIYKRTGTTWTLEQAVTVSFASGANYNLGVSVAINDAGDVIAAGFGSTLGSVDIYTRSGTTWTRKTSPLSTGALDSTLTVACSADGTVVASGGSGTVKVFRNTAGTWSSAVSITSTSGAEAIALSADGSTLAVGDTAGNSSKGNVRIYTYAASAWSLQQTLTDSTGSTGDDLGASLSLSNNGNTLVVGAPTDDISSVTNQGSAVVYTRSGSTWTQAHRLTYSAGAANDYFGQSVTINGAGDRIVVGTSQDDVGINADRGSLVVYDYSGSVWDETTTLLAASGIAGDKLGSSVAISDDGLYIVGGAPYDDVATYTDHGSASIFALTTTTAAGVTVGDGTVTEAKLANSAVTSAKILDGTIVNADINASAAIAYGKLALTTSIVNGDISNSAAIAYSKLALTGSIVNADVATGAAIAYSKLALTSSIVNADIASGAAIALSKLATDPLARANHTGTQTASTISDFDTQVRTSRLDQMAAPTGSVSLNSQKITSLATPTTNTDAATKAYVDTAAAAGVNFGTPGSIQPDDAAAAGSASTAARSDHTHAIAAASASTISGSNAEGTSTSFARADHDHALGTGVVTSTNILDGTVANGDLAGSIALSKLASGTDKQIIVANASGVPTYVALSGDATIANTGAITVNKITGFGTDINDFVFGTGSVSLTSAAAGNATQNITWGDGAAHTPVVVIANITGQTNYTVMTDTYTTSGTQGRFTARVKHIDNTSQTTTVNFNYIAIY